MLSHEEPARSETVPFPERRITPHELTRALASIEAYREEDARRQEEEQRYFASTLTVGEAVSTLSLDVTPDQLWAEVQMLREADRREPPGPPSEPSNHLFEQAAREAEALDRPPAPVPDQSTQFRIYHSQSAEDLDEDASPLSPHPMTGAEQVREETDWNGIKPEENTEQEKLQTSKDNNSLKIVFSLVGGGLMILCLLSWFATLNNVPNTQTNVYRGPSSVSQPYQPPQTYSLPSFGPFVSNQRPTSGQSVSAIPDETAFGLSTSSLNDLLKGQSQDTVFLFDAERDMRYDKTQMSPEDFDINRPSNVLWVRKMVTGNDWTAIKHKGQLYLHGWIDSQLSNSGATLHITNTSTAQDIGSHPVQVTIPLNKNTYMGMYRYTPPRLLFNADAQKMRRPRYLGMGVVLANVHLDSHAYEKWTP